MNRYTWRPCLFVYFLLFMFVLAGCFSQTATPPPTAPSSPSTTSTTSPLTASHPAQGDDWPTYHRDLARSGFDSAVSLNGSLQRLWMSDSLDGDIYAEPLIVGERLIAATEQNSVYSLDVNTGKTQWQVNLGSPVSLLELACGDIDPSGITGTPVADPTTRHLYVVARIEPNHHEIFSLDIETGSILWHPMVDPPGANPSVQQQRAALVLANSSIYVAFGGLYGDCGSYYGWLVGAAYLLPRFLT